MNTLPTKDFFHDGIYVIRGLKDEQGNLYTFTRKKPTTRNPMSIGEREILAVNAGEVISIPDFEPFPYAEFTTFDDYHTKNYKRTYLKVRLKENLTSRQINSLTTSIPLSSQFGEKEIIMLSEFKKPFQYTLNYLNSGEGGLSVSGLVAWLIHDRIRSRDEKKAIDKILQIAHERYKATPYLLDISLDSGTLRYIKTLRELDDSNKIMYGNKGFVKIDKNDIINGDRCGYLDELDLLYLADKINSVGVLFHHSALNVGFYKQNIADKEIEKYFTEYLCSEDIDVISETGFSMGYLAKRNIIKQLAKPTKKGCGKYSTNGELVSDVNYQSIKIEHDSCDCYRYKECKGCYVAPNGVSCIYDEQVEVLSQIIDSWGDYLKVEHVDLFSNWSRDIFNRYLANVNDNYFVNMLHQN